MTDRKVFPSSDESNAEMIAVLVDLVAAESHVEIAGDKIYESLVAHRTNTDPDTVILSPAEVESHIQLLSKLVAVRTFLMEITGAFRIYDSYEELVAEAMKDTQ